MNDWDKFDRMFDMIDEIMKNDFTGGVKIGGNNPKYPVEIMQDTENIYLTLSLGNVQKEDIFIDLSPNLVHFRILTEEGEYDRGIELPSEVDPKSIQDTFKNGILDLVIKKK